MKTPPTPAGQVGLFGEAEIAPTRTSKATGSYELAPVRRLNLALVPSGIPGVRTRGAWQHTTATLENVVHMHFDHVAREVAADLSHRADLAGRALQRAEGRCAEALALEVLLDPKVKGTPRAVAQTVMALVALDWNADMAKAERAFTAVLEMGIFPLPKNHWEHVDEYDAWIAEHEKAIASIRKKWSARLWEIAQTAGPIRVRDADAARMTEEFLKSV